MKTSKQYIYIILIALITISWQNLRAQDNTMFYLGTVPQTYYLNPANQPNSDFYLGLVNNATSITTGSLSANDLIWNDPLTDSIIHPLHENADKQEFLNKFDNNESIGLNTAQTLLSFGFRVKEMYFSFDAILKSSNELSYSKDFAEFILIEQGNNVNFDLSNVGVEIMNYTEMGINVSRNFGSQWQVGIRPKMLIGLGTISTLNSSTSLTTSTSGFTLDADYQARIAAVGLTIPVDEDGLFDPKGNIDFDSTLNSSDGYKRILSQNIGFGVDIGANYKPIDKVQVSISVLDLGYIKWKDDTHIATINGSYNFAGLDILNDSTDLADGVIDSLKENLNLTGSGDDFKTRLNPKLLIGGRYFLTPGIDFGVLSRTEFYKSYINQEIILSANLHPSRHFAISGSYSFLNKDRSTFGLGLAFNLAPLNIYVILDDIPFQYDYIKLKDMPVNIPLPVNMHNYNFRIGLNLRFGGNKDKKLRQDKPLYNSSDWIL